MSIRRDDLDAGKVDLADVIDKRRASMRPCPSGDVLRMEFLKPMKLSAYRLAKDINVSLNRVAGILAGKRAITPTRRCGWRAILALTRNLGSIFRRGTIWR